MKYLSTITIILLIVALFVSTLTKPDRNQDERVSFYDSALQEAYIMLDKSHAQFDTLLALHERCNSDFSTSIKQCDAQFNQLLTTCEEKQLMLDRLDQKLQMVYRQLIYLEQELSYKTSMLDACIQSKNFELQETDL